MGDIEGFDSDQAKAVDDLSRLLMVEVMATVANTLMDSSDDLLRSTPPFASVLVFDLIKLPLCVCQFLLIGAEEARIGDELPSGESRELLNPNVDTDFIHRDRQRFCFDFTGDRDEPFSALTFHGHGFRSAVKRAMNNGFDRSDLGENHRVLFYLIAVAVLFPGETIVDASAFLSGRLRTFLVLLEQPGLLALLIVCQTPEVGLVSQLNTCRDVLQDMCMNGCEFRVGNLPLRYLLLLLVLGRSFALYLETELAVVQKTIVEFSTHVQSRLQFGLLRTRWVYAVLEGFSVPLISSLRTVAQNRKASAKNFLPSVGLKPLGGMGKGKPASPQDESVVACGGLEAVKKTPHPRSLHSPGRSYTDKLTAAK